MDEPLSTGLNPTLRQLMILVIWAGLLSAATRAVLQWRLFGDRPEILCMIVPIHLGVYPMPALAILLWAFDRPGKVRDWYRSSCMIGANLASGGLFLLQDPTCYALTGKPTQHFPMALFLGPICLLAGWHQWRAARPRVCPSCGLKSVIPIAHPARPRSKRLVNSGKRGWCASCGATFERMGKGAWQLPGPAA
ncbi:hypothetical protein P12x_000026 [Tundrisphaera lichenicola]|uniref:hypothetical protein n=1 Tax=Tundrisphaera lichenicola TaxID=2029860 RepID=UPI003EB86855